MFKCSSFLCVCLIVGVLCEDRRWPAWTQINLKTAPTSLKTGVKMAPTVLSQNLLETHLGLALNF